MDQRRTYIILSILISSAFALTTIAETLYWIETAGLKPWQLILLGSALEVSVLVFEIPTGVFADRKGRKKTCRENSLPWRARSAKNGITQPRRIDRTILIGWN